jgi:hypothetical protein
VFSHAKFPNYDANTQAAVHFLTQGRYGNHEIRKTKTTDSEWYLGTFCAIIRDLEEACAARDRASRRRVDKSFVLLRQSSQVSPKKR